MKAEILHGHLVVTIPLQPAQASASGKTKVIASTRGNKVLCQFEGKPVTIGLNAYIPAQ
jgi:hypothetical protein